MEKPKELARLPDNAQLPDMVRYEISTGNVEPQVAQMMFELQTAWEKREAEKEFIAARARLKFPAITKNKRGVNSHYASWDAIQEIIDPILQLEGFTLSFTSGQPNEQGLIPITGKLSHRLGHSEIGTLYQPIGAVSRGMNANQAMGSAISYGQRYCAAMMLNLRFVDMDDDADSLSTLLEEEREKIENSLRTLNDKAGRDCMPELLAGLRVKAIGDIRRADLARAMEMLRFMYRQIGGKKKL